MDTKCSYIHCGRCSLFLLNYCIPRVHCEQWLQQPQSLDHLPYMLANRHPGSSQTTQWCLFYIWAYVQQNWRNVTTGVYECHKAPGTDSAIYGVTSSYPSLACSWCVISTMVSAFWPKTNTRAPDLRLQVSCEATDWKQKCTKGGRVWAHYNSYEVIAAGMQLSDSMIIIHLT